MSIYINMYKYTVIYIYIHYYIEHKSYVPNTICSKYNNQMKNKRNLHNLHITLIGERTPVFSVL